MPVIDGVYFTDDELAELGENAAPVDRPRDEDGNELGAPPNSEWDPVHGRWRTADSTSGGADDWNERARRDPNFNPRDAMIDRDRGSWESRLRHEARTKFGGNVSDDKIKEYVDDVTRQVSYAQNAGKDPGTFLNAALAKMEREQAPTGHRPHDSQISDQAKQAANTAADAARARAAGPAGVGGPRSLGSFGSPTGFTGTGGGDLYTTGGTTSTSLGSAYQYQPFAETFVGPQAPADLMTPWGRTFVGPQAPADLMDQWTGTYVRPTAADLRTDPGVEVRLDAQQRAMERSAAAKGTLLTGGHQRSLAEYGQELASNEYQRLVDRSMQEYLNAFQTFITDKQRRSNEFGNTFGRALSGYQTDFNVDQADKARRSGEFGNTYGRALGEFGQRRDIHDTNQLNAFQVGRAGRMDDFNIGRTTKMDDFNIGDVNRRFGFDVDKDLHSRYRSGYLDDFNMWRTLDRDRAADQFRLADYGRPLA